MIALADGMLPQTAAVDGMLPQTTAVDGMLPQTVAVDGMLPQTVAVDGMLPQLRVSFSSGENDPAMSAIKGGTLGDAGVMNIYEISNHSRQDCAKLQLHLFTYSFVHSFIL